MSAAVLLLALAAALLIGPAPALAGRRLDARPAVAERATPRRGRILAAAAVILAAVAGAPQLAGWTLSLAVAALAGVLLVRAHRDRARRAAARAECAGATRLLASLLRSGQLPSPALAQAAEDFAVLRPAAAAAELGADVGGRLAETALQPGCGGLRPVASAWRLSERTGAPMAEVLGRVAERVREQRRLDGVVAAELAATRASGRIMAVLPAAAVLLGAATGVDNVGVLVGAPVGQFLVLGSVILAVAGVVWVERLADSTERGRAR